MKTIETLRKELKEALMKEKGLSELDAEELIKALEDLAESLAKQAVRDSK